MYLTIFERKLQHTYTEMYQEKTDLSPGEAQLKTNQRTT